MSEWYMAVPLMVFTKIKQDFSQKIKDAYGMTDKNFSTVGRRDANPVFPFVYVQTLPTMESGQDLEGASVNGAMFGFQIDVYSNKSQTEARKVMTEVARIMKSMRFEINAMPTFEDSTDMYRMTARFRRMFGANDILNS